MPDHDIADPATAIARLGAEVERLRTRLDGISDEVRTRQVVIVDADGADRINLDAASDGRLTLTTADGFARVVIAADNDRGAVTIHSRGTPPEQTYVEVFALDPEDASWDLDPDDDASSPYVGVELIDRGNSVAGFSLYESRHPRLWSWEPGPTPPVHHWPGPGSPER